MKFDKIYRQSPVKSPDIENIIVVTLTFLFGKVPHCVEETYIRAKVPNSFTKRMKLILKCVL